MMSLCNVVFFQAVSLAQQKATQHSVQRTGGYAPRLKGVCPFGFFLRSKFSLPSPACR